MKSRNLRRRPINLLIQVWAFPKKVKEIAKPKKRIAWRKPWELLHL